MDTFITKTIVGLLMILSQLGICSVGVIMTTNSLKDIADLSSLNPAFVILLPCYLVLVFFMNALHHDAHIGAIVNLLNASGLGLIFYHIFKEPQKEVVFIYPDAGGLSFTSGIIIFNLSAVGVILNTDKGLKNSRIMTKSYGVINVGLGMPTLVSTVFGALGYWAFGTMEESVLRSLPFEDLTALIAIGIYLVSVVTSFALNCYPAITVIVEMIKYRKKKAIPSQGTLVLIERVAKLAFVLIAFAIAYNVPHQGPCRAFVGHLCTTMLSVVFPAIMDICLRSGVPNGYGKYNYHLIKDLIIIFLGCSTWLLGIYYCGYLIHIRILSSYSPNNEGF